MWLEYLKCLCIAVAFICFSVIVIDSLLPSGAGERPEERITCPND